MPISTRKMNLLSYIKRVPREAIYELTAGTNDGRPKIRVAFSGFGMCESTFLTCFFLKSDKLDACKIHLLVGCENDLFWKNYFLNFVLKSTVSE